MIATAVFTEVPRLVHMPVFNLALPRPTDPQGMGKVMSIVERALDQRFRKEEPIEKQDMLQSFMSHGIGHGQLKSELLTLVVAGLESTATALRTALYYISSSPEVLRKVFDEALEAHRSGKLTRPVVKNSEAKEMPYLQACIWEALRMKPPIHGLQAKQVPPNGWEVDGTYAPPGTWIAFNTFGAMRDPATFGTDCDVFQPERWILAENASDSQKAQVEHMQKAVSVIFGAGRYLCVGKTLAMMELGKAVLETLLRFELEPVSQEKPFNEKFLGFVIHKDMLFNVRERGEIFSRSNMTEMVE